MLFILVFIFLVYVALMIFLLWGWHKAVTTPCPDNRNEEMITILIPARNEAENIILLLSDLQKQEDQLFEVIVIDDHSEDNTFNEVAKFISSGFRGLRILKLIRDQGKKSALTLGVREAKGSLIVTTDGDCRVDKKWLSGFRKCFSDPSVRFAFGGVRIHLDGKLWSSMQAIELASLIGSGAATNALERPTLCNGANLAFRKDDFNAVGGYSGNEHISSGDDEFLLRKMHSRFPGSIRFVTYPENIVETKGVSLCTFVHQRIRWAGKWRAGNDVSSIMLAVFIFAFHAGFLAGIVWLAIGYNFILLIAVFTLKSFLEFVFLRKVMLFLNSRWNWSAFITLQFTYSIYVISIGILANLKSPVWKGRKIRRVDLKIDPVLRQNH